MKASDYIVEFIAKRGTDTAFVFTGGAISHVIDSFRHYQDHIRYVCVHNEQVGAMAAEAYSRTTGKMGVAMATSGPGGTNLITGIVGAWYDCVPALYITGQVRTWELTGQDRLLQRGFQEVAIVDMVKPVTKYAVTVTQAVDLRYELEKAYAMAFEGRPGPALLDIPMDVQWADIDPASLRSYESSSDAACSVSEENLAQIVECLHQASRPLIIAGGGVRQGKAEQEFRQFVDKAGIPVIASYAGYDLLPYDHPCQGGVMGQFGHYGANHATAEADLILALGTRFSIKQVGNNLKDFAPQAKVLAINVDQGELRDGRVQADVSIHANLKDVLTKLMTLDFKADPQWCDYVTQLKTRYAIQPPAQAQDEPVNLYRLIQELSTWAQDDAIIIPDVGQNVIVTAQAIQLKEHQRLFSSWANSPMGFSMPASIGVQCGFPNRQVICIIGDGGLQVNIQDLQTIVNYGLPVKILLLNNGCYATIHEYQGPNLEGRFEATDKAHGYSHPDFQQVFQAYGFRRQVIRSVSELCRLEEFLRQPGPSVCEVTIDSLFRVSPNLAGNDPLHHLSPKIEIESFQQSCVTNLSTMF